jgi:large subunit ribosomal protein L29
MKPAEIRDWKTEELKSKLNESREELMNLRFQMATGSLTDYTRLKQTRQDIARMLTILTEREVNEGAGIE